VFSSTLNLRMWVGGVHTLGRGYCVSAVGLDEQVIRECIKNQEQEDKRQEQIKLAGL